MAYKGMSERFAQKMDEIYAKYSLRGPSGVGQPYFEYKPNDPARRDTAHDSRFSPNESAKRDFSRIEKFLTSPSGLKFMISQAELQAGNTFSETRIYNPLFPFGRLQGNWFRITRPLGTARGEGVGAAGTSASVIGSIIKGASQASSPDAASVKSPGSDATVGGAGRLQKATSRHAVDLVLGRSGPTGLLNLLPPNRLTRAASAVKNILETGILDVNQRPELDVDGQYFSIALWTGFSRTQTEPNSFVKAGAQLRKGDIKGAISSLSSGIVNQLKTSVLGSKGTPVPNSARQGRDDPSRTDLSGLRYFIVNDSEADRYLQNSVQDTSPTVEFLNRLPYGLVGDSVLYNDKQIVTQQSLTEAAAQPQQQAQVASQKQSFLSKVGGFLKTAASVLFGGSSIPGTNVHIGPTDPKTGRLLPGALTDNPFAQNPGEERMLFGTLSLTNKYADATGDVQFVRDGLEQQKAIASDYIKKLKSERTYNIGYVGGLSAGEPIVDDYGIFASARTKAADGRYFSDGAVQLNAIMLNKDVSANSRVIHPDLKNEIRAGYNDTIDFMFHDYVNNQIIPFRAILNGINETVTTEFDTQRYVGRTEKNIVYAGATRELTFTFYVQAFSKQELSFIWEKINYVTGLCFPAAYSDGFMVPPFVQLTIGNLYVDQPGYIKSISNVIDENTSWDIDVDAQVPMGITVSVSFSVIEKTQVRTGYGFYGFGAPSPISINSQTSITNVLPQPINT